MLLLMLTFLVGTVAAQETEEPGQADGQALLAAYRAEVRQLRLDGAGYVYRLALAETAVDSMEAVHRWQIEALERALDASERHWWNDERLWFAAGALSVALLVDVTVQATR